LRGRRAEGLVSFLHVRHLVRPLSSDSAHLTQR
jgi:hypothetical protein